MAVLDSGVSTAGKANVDANFNLKVATPTGGTSDPMTSVGFVAAAAEYDDGTIATAGGTRKLNKLRSSIQRRLTVGQDVCLFNDWPGAANTSVWSWLLTSMTTVTGSGWTQLNFGSSVAINTNARIQTVQKFSAPSDGSLYFEGEYMYTVTPQANSEMTIGFFEAAAGAVPTDGVYFQWDTTGVLKAVQNNVGATVSSAALTAPAANTRFTLKIEVEDDGANFYINDKLVAQTTTASGVPKPFNIPSLSFQARILNGGSSPALANTLKVGPLYVGWQDAAGQNYPGHHLAAYRGEGGYQYPTGGVMGSTQNYANSANPTAAVPTNTTAALTAGLGGQFWETDTLAAGTDGVVQSFQIPTSGAGAFAKSLVILGVTIQSVVSTALAAGGYTASWSLAFGHTAVSLATAETLGTSKAPRRVGVGWQVTPANAAVHTTLPPINFRFDGAPLIVHPGEFIQAVKKKAFGTAPTAGVVSHLVTYDCAWV